MNAKHTPGPWAVSGSLIVGPKNEVIARVTHFARGHKIYPDEDRDARLIAAAPEMHKVIKELYAALDGPYPGEMAVMAVNRKLAVARAILARIEGHRSA